MKGIKKKEMSEIVEKITLGLFQVGAEEINFQIIIMLPTDIKKIMKKTGLTKVPVNNRVNELEKYGLAFRYKHQGDGLVTKGVMTDLFLEMYKEMFTDVKQNFVQKVKQIIKST